MMYSRTQVERSLLHPAQSHAIAQPSVSCPLVTVVTVGNWMLVMASDHSTLSTSRLRPVLSVHSMLEKVVSAPAVLVL